MIWYLVMIATGQYIGPLAQDACLAAAQATASEGIVCRQVQAMTACPVPGHPESYIACPVFDFPQVTKRDKSY